MAKISGCEIIKGWSNKGNMLFSTLLSLYKTKQLLPRSKRIPQKGG